MKMKHSLTMLTVVCGLAAMLGASLQAAVITLTAEVDKPLLLADRTQTAYLRIGLTGCPQERLKERTPVNVAMVIDKSGSMSGDRIRYAREAAILALQRLNADDIVSVVVYDSQVQVLVPATKMTRREDIIRAIRRIEAGGTTALYAGVQAGAEEVCKFQTPGRVNRVVLLSDGQANVGPQTPEALGRLGAQLAEKGLSVTTIGLGLGYNEDLMSRLADKSDGGHYFAESPNELASVFDREFDRALSVVAQEIRIEIILPKGIRPVRLLGREGTIKGQSVTIELGSVYSEHEKYVLLETEMAAAEPLQMPVLVADVKVVYRDTKKQETHSEKARITAGLTTETEAVTRNLNKRVAADVVEQIAIEQNERATALRDEGKMEQARQVLTDNAASLKRAAAEYGSPALDKYAEENSSQAEQLDESSWTRSRKQMVESQSARRSQR